jgi:hypothetical protein
MIVWISSYFKYSSSSAEQNYVFNIGILIILFMKYWHSQKHKQSVEKNLLEYMASPALNNSLY